MTTHMSSPRLVVHPELHTGDQARASVRRRPCRPSPLDARHGRAQLPAAHGSTGTAATPAGRRAASEAGARRDTPYPDWWRHERCPRYLRGPAHRTVTSPHRRSSGSAVATPAGAYRGRPGIRPVLDRRVHPRELGATVRRAPYLAAKTMTTGPERGTRAARRC